MPVSDKEHFDALRASDQRAIELLAKAQADSVTRAQFNWMLLLTVASFIVAIAALFLKH